MPPRFSQLGDGAAKGTAAHAAADNFERVMALVGMSAAFGTILPSPFIAVLLVHELLVSGGNEIHNSNHFMKLHVLMALAATVAFCVYTGAEDYTMLSSLDIPPAELVIDSSEGKWIRYCGAAVPIGIVCGVVGFFGVIFIGVGRKLGGSTYGRISTVAGSGVKGEVAAMVLTPVIGGGLIGLLAVAFPLTLGDGDSQLGTIATDAIRYNRGDSPIYAWDYLIVLAIAKMATLGLSLGFGFIGGQIFPLLFSGVCVGAAMLQVFDRGMPVTVALPCCMIAVPMAITPILLSLTALAATTFALGGAGSAPVYVAGFVAYTTVTGMGVMQALLEVGIANLNEQCQQLGGISSEAVETIAQNPSKVVHDEPSVCHTSTV